MDEISPRNSPSRPSANRTDINQTLNLVLEQLKSQKEELSSLRDDVKGTSLSVSSEVKKIKDKELSWRKEDNKIQYNFNTDIEDSVVQAKWAITNNKSDYALEVLEETAGKLHKRKKLIRIADTSEGGWETVRQYQANPVASDSDDESKISKAENRALRKRKRFQSKKSPNDATGKRTLFPRPTSTVGSIGSVPFPQWGMQPSTSGTFPGVNGSLGTSNFRPYTRKTFGSCFACGDFTHYRKDCPYMSGSFNKQSQSAIDVTQNRK
ncbi:uncharacterized protein LOC123554984 [Mercenaria mercenaria]|uniref:uncharacterized protein LOC123554984 n=1 Tax=Mercenaria mercenaria TaxID=6596 RepID=UPI00234F5C3D|nr:uncharacterized protein LOC123554984 [Mercenaria mercenaria]